MAATTKKLAYYPGCSLHSTAKELDESFRASAAALSLELTEIPDWVCCGNTAAHATNRLLAAALPANELAKVTDMGLDTVAVPCAACFSRFMVSVSELEDEHMKDDIARVIGRVYGGGVGVDNLIDVYYNEVGVDQLKARTVRPLSGLKAVAYYGCLLTRPPKTTLAEDPEYPTHMDDLLRAMSATVLDWSYKTDCCGASLALCEQSVVVALTKKILRDATTVGADMVVCACPLCQANLDTRQDEIAAADSAFRKIPVLYLSQVVGVAIGLSPDKLGFRRHMVPVEPLLQRAGAAV